MTKRFVVLSDDRVIAEDAAQIISDRASVAHVECVATLPEAMDALDTKPVPMALVIIKPRRPLVGHPLLAAAQERNVSVIVLSEDDISGEALDGHTFLESRVPFTSASLGTLISEVVRDRPPG